MDRMVNFSHFDFLKLLKLLIKMAVSVAFLFLFSPSLFAINSSSGNIDQDFQEVTLHYFWSKYCPHCKAAKPFVNRLPVKYPWLKLHSYELVDSIENQKRFIAMAKKLGRQANSVPAFIFCRQMMVGYGQAETTGQELENRLLDCHHHKESKKQVKQEYLDIPWLGKVHFQDFSLPVFTAIIALLDAFNPCAFFVLLFLLSLIGHARNRTKILAIGGIFIFCSGLIYFLFMSAWLNLFLITKRLVFFTSAAGLIAITFGLINIKDFFFFKKGASLSISNADRSKLFDRIRTLTQSDSWFTMIVATVILAIAANSYELLCTAGLPMVFTRILTLNDLSTTQYYLYLAFYNIIYIIPLLIIVVLFTLTLGSKKLSEHEGRLLKLLSGSMMLGLGAILLFKPQWLSNMMVSIVIILASILLTLAIALIGKIISRQ